MGGGGDTGTQQLVTWGHEHTRTNLSTPTCFGAQCPQVTQQLWRGHLLLTHLTARPARWGFPQQARPELGKELQVPSPSCGFLEEGAAVSMDSLACRSLQARGGGTRASPSILTGSSFPNRTGEKGSFTRRITVGLPVNVLGPVFSLGKGGAPGVSAF